MTKSEARRELWFAATLGAFGVALLLRVRYISELWPEPLSPRQYPMMVSAGLVVAAILAVVDTLRRSRRMVSGQEDDPRASDSQATPAGAAARGAATGPQTPQRAPAWYGPLFLGVLSVLYLVGQVTLGFYVSTFGFLLLGMVALASLSSEDLTFQRVVLVYLPVTLLLVAGLYGAARLLSVYIPTGGVLM